MRYKVVAVAIPCALALAAYTGDTVRPGQWTAQSNMVSMEIPGMPANMANMMKGKPFTHSYCLTAEQAENAPEAMFKETNGQCRYTSFDMAGGKLDAVAVCTHEMGDARMRMTGSYTATSYSADNHMTISSPQGTVKTHAHVEGRRTGDC